MIAHIQHTIRFLYSLHLSHILLLYRGRQSQQYHLCYQIEHHLFPDLPSNRLAQIAVRVQEVCDKYDLPYTSSSLVRQYFLVLRTIHKLALPDRFLIATSDDAPETASEKKFVSGTTSVAVEGDPLVGLRTALRERARKTPTLTNRAK